MSTLYEVVCVSDQISVPTEKAGTKDHAACLYHEMIEFIKAYTGMWVIATNGPYSTVFNDGTTVQIFRIS